MPLPTPTTEESKNEFVARCMSDSKMQGEYPDAQQRIAVCMVQYGSWYYQIKTTCLKKANQAIQMEDQLDQ